MNEIISIVEQQLLSVVESWDGAVETYDETLPFWRDAEFHIRYITEEQRFIDSYNTVPWDEFIRPNSVALDIGCGSGWLSALLSKHSSIKKIYALDSSRSNLKNLLPEVVDILGGNLSKIQPVLGLFDKLEVLDKKFDLVVASASLHHSTDIRETLRGLSDTLSDNGSLVLLNELPSSKFRYGYRVFVGAIRALRDLGLGRFPKETPMYSSPGILYNRKLGDWTYCIDQWRCFLKEAKFSVKEIPLDYSHRCEDRKSWRREKFVNFVCSKSI